MNIVNKIKDFLDNLDIKNFYKYSGIFIGVITLLSFFLIYRFYSNIDHYKRQIRNLNDVRQEVQELLEKASSVKQQKEQVNAMLEADPNFKIAGYFKEILAQLNLTNKQISSTVTTQERGEQDYNESILSAKFGDMNMKNVSELLNLLEQNKRVYTKELEIQKSRKTPRAIEVQLTIATLQPRTG
ncbi:MAG: hypothetical protein WD055_05170 [Candidatus Dependentiae bacterium]